MYGDDEETGSPPREPEKPESDRSRTIEKRGVPDVERERRREKNNDN